MSHDHLIIYSLRSPSLNYSRETMKNSPQFAVYFVNASGSLEGLQREFFALSAHNYLEILEAEGDLKTLKRSERGLSNCGS